MKDELFLHVCWSPLSRVQCGSSFTAFCSSHIVVALFSHGTRQFPIFFCLYLRGSIPSSPRHTPGSFLAGPDERHRGRPPFFRRATAAIFSPLAAAVTPFGSSACRTLCLTQAGVPTLPSGFHTSGSVPSVRRVNWFFFPPFVFFYRKFLWR